MSEKPESKWEYVCQDDFQRVTSRLAVDGGWIYQVSDDKEAALQFVAKSLISVNGSVSLHNTHSPATTEEWLSDLIEKMKGDGHGR